MRWRIPKMWEGGEVFILGGGPSVTEQFAIPDEVVKKVRSGELPPSAYSPYMESIHNHHVIGINAAFLIGPWIDMMFFGDKSFCRKYHDELIHFPGIIVTGEKAFESDRIRWIRVVPFNRKKGVGISNDPGTVCWNANSGAAAISLAANAGARRIVLIGFDMKLGKDGAQWWHTFYTGGKRLARQKQPFPRHLRGFAQIAKDARRRKIEIVNASPDSAITQFKKVNLRDIL